MGQKVVGENYAGATYAGPPGSPGMVSAISEAMPTAQVSSVNSLPSTPPTEASLIGRATPLPIGTEAAPSATLTQEVTTQTVPVEYPESPAEKAARQAAIWEAGAASQALRQSGLSFGQGDHFFSSIASSEKKDDQIVLSRWKAWLPQFGVEPSKIEDESRRLSRPMFDAWASRFVWFACSPQSGDIRPAGCDQLGN